MKQNIKISEIKLNPNNPRLIKDDKFKKLVQSIKDFPEMLNIRPIVVNKDMIILGGNMRYKACKEAGLKEVPIIITDLTEDQQREFLIKDNTSGGEWDWEVLQNEWNTEELDSWGLDLPAFEVDEVLEAEEDDFESTTLEDPISVLGDLYEIGEHRLLCGDSTCSDNVAKLMNGEKADMVFTDPPYNTGMTSKGQNDSTRLNHMFDDNYTDDEWEDFMQGFLNSYNLFTKDNSFLFICLDWRRSYQLIPHIKNNFHLSNLIVWDKMVHGLGSDYKYTHEFIHVCKKGKPELARNKDGEKEYQDIWHIQRKMGRDEEHATKKPIEICERAIKHTSNKLDIVLDLFLGSGSTMVASHQLKRKCYGMELDPKYCDVIVKRMIKLDDTLTIKRNGVDVTKDCK
jgi:DNA modification methylase